MKRDETSCKGYSVNTYKSMTYRLFHSFTLDATSCHEPGKNAMPSPRTLEWIGGSDGFLRLIDQTQLPTIVTFRDCRTVEDVWEAIRSLRVRGAPAIGVAAAMGV